MDLLKLAFAFAQVGIGAFGGGISTIPLIEHILVNRYGWLTPQAFGEVLAIAQVTPGPIAVNAATFVGYRNAGLAGAFIATFAVVATPLLLLIVVCALLKCGPQSWTDRFRTALRPTVAALLTLALLPLGRSVLASPASGLLFAAALGAFRLRFFRDNPPALFLLAGLVGLVLWR